MFRLSPPFSRRWVAADECFDAIEKRGVAEGATDYREASPARIGRLPLPGANPFRKPRFLRLFDRRSHRQDFVAALMRDHDMTRTEAEIALLIADGLKPSQIAALRYPPAPQPCRAYGGQSEENPLNDVQKGAPAPGEAAVAPVAAVVRYVSELRQHWRPLTGALIGLGTGFSFNQYVTSIMAPHMLAEFGWSRSEFAAVGGLSLIMVAMFPVVGRINDMLGVRRTALIGVIALPLAYGALSLQNGDIRVYIALFILQAGLCITTTATVFTRVVVQHVERARGLALALVASGPALFGAIVAPMLNEFVEAYGWRQGYIALAGFTATAGVLALLILPPHRKAADAPLTHLASAAQRTKEDYKEIFADKAFWILAVALLLCNLPQVIALTQLSLVLVENGVATGDASAIISLFATGTLVGRFLCGLALDRFPTHIVAAIGMGLPAIGLFLIASDIDARPVLAASVFLFALSLGAEGDLVGYLVVRTFGVRIYSSVMGLMTAAISTSASLGAFLLSYTLGVTDTFVTFLTICGFTVIIGSLLFLRLKPAVSHKPTA